MYKLLELPKILDPRGNLTFLQHPSQLPFNIERVFWTYDVPGGGTRGGHAFIQQEEVIIALSGSFDVVFTAPDGKQEKVHMNRSYYGLHVPALTWRHIENFSTNSLALVLSSTSYNEKDYIRDFETYVGLKAKKQ
jgi:hypothetical protein